MLVTKPLSITVKTTRLTNKTAKWDIHNSKVSLFDLIVVLNTMIFSLTIKSQPPENSRESLQSNQALEMGCDGSGCNKAIL